MEIKFKYVLINILKKLRILFSAFIFILLCTLMSCSSAGVNACLSSENDDARLVYVVGIGWHTGIIFPPHNEITELPELSDFPRNNYTEIGWGDKAYYMSEEPSFGTLLFAGVFPTSSVLHVNSFSADPEIFFSSGKVIELKLNNKSYRKLKNYIENSFQRKDDSNRAENLGEGLYRLSSFYTAEGTFWALNNCNTWIGRALKEAGCPVGMFLPITANGLMGRVEAINDKALSIDD